mmetsp:Transcript_68797/g.119470  ORF Transcript_68797/g.119470 Transcript_68797/m.119470 type:complete len:212 (+) Transcript_68797:291-926(+)
MVVLLHASLGEIMSRKRMLQTSIPLRWTVNSSTLQLQSALAAAHIAAGTAEDAAVQPGVRRSPHWRSCRDVTPSRRSSRFATLLQALSRVVTSCFSVTYIWGWVRPLINKRYQLQRTSQAHHAVQEPGPRQIRALPISLALKPQAPMHLHAFLYRCRCQSHLLSQPRHAAYCVQVPSPTCVLARVPVFQHSEERPPFGQEVHTYQAVLPGR